MKIVIKGTDLSLTPAIKDYLEKKLLHLEKFLPKIEIARVELQKLHGKHSGTSFRAEVNLDAPGRVFRAESAASDAYAAIDTVLPKLIMQLEKRKLKQLSNRRSRARRLKAEME